jgi:hypothetical protein
MTGEKRKVEETNGNRKIVGERKVDWHRTGKRSGYARHLYSLDNWFESRPGHWLP